jgi:hypothetical protein
MLTLIYSTNWPVITKKHDDLGQAFLDRMARDQCSPFLTWNYSNDGLTVISVTVTTATGNKCGVPIPVTVPGNVRSIPTGATKEQIGADPLTVWTKMTGQPTTIQLNPPLRL